MGDLVVRGIADDLSVGEGPAVVLVFLDGGFDLADEGVHSFLIAGLPDVGRGNAHGMGHGGDAAHAVLPAGETGNGINKDEDEVKQQNNGAEETPGGESEEESRYSHSRDDSAGSAGGDISTGAAGLRGYP